MEADDEKSRLGDAFPGPDDSGDDANGTSVGQRGNRWASTKLWRRVALLLLFVGLSGALAARSGFGASTGSTSLPLYPLLPTTAPAPSITPLPTTTPVPTVTPTATAYAPPCLASHLRLSLAPFGGVAMGHAAWYFQFTNDGSVACSLRGFPTIRLLDRAGKALPVKVTPTTQAFLWFSIPINTIELPAGGAAYFEVQVDDVSETGSPCLTAAKTLIAPPQSGPGFGGFVSSTNLSSCDGVLDVSPVMERMANR